MISAWLNLQVVAVVMLALDVDVPEELGYPALIVLWAVVWTIWRRRLLQGGREQERLWATGALGTMQRVFAAICVAVLLIGNVVLVLDGSGAVERTACRRASSPPP